ncbi:MAG: hypothetical protein ACI8PZ_001624 [Myxococcota bacterium]|jgi:hypothetical protein
MPNAYISRENVHAWSRAVGEDPGEQAALHRVLKNQRRLSKFIEENAEDLGGQSGGVAMFLLGTIARLFDRVGGRMKSGTWEQVRTTQARVQAATMELLPLEGFAERARGVEWRAQPHILDEALMALFETEAADDVQEDLDPVEALKVYMLLWVATEVLDQNWRAPKNFDGETEYTYVHIDASPDDADADATVDE